MSIPAVLSLALVLPQGADPRSQGGKPTSRPSGPTDAERMVEAEWPDDAPGRQVARRGGKQFKWLPMRKARYGSPADVADRVRSEDLVIGLVVGGQPVAYPINMLGGPQREIVNEVHAGVAFCVNW